jgi:integrase
MARQHLTDKSIATLPAKARQTEYHDTVLRGLVLRVTASGARTYGVRYRFAGQPRRLHIGEVGVLSLADARQQARGLLVDVARGTDPAAVREAESRAAEDAHQRSERTLLKLAEMWLSSRESKEWRPRTRKEFERITRRVILPALGDRDPNGVSRGEARKLLDDVAEGKGVIGEGPKAKKRTTPAPTEANRVYATLHLLYQWLHKERQQWLGVTAHPLAGLEKPSLERPRTRTYSNHEIRSVLSAASGTELADFLPFLFHTATRSEETRAMKWTDVDFERALWTIPPEATKTGEITGEPHIVPLSAGALQILARRRGQKVAPLSPYVFPAPSGGHIRHPHRAIPALRAQSSVLDFRLHDVRRTVSQRIAEEFGEGMNHSILGHARQRLGRTYIPNRPLKEQREGLEWWSAELSRLLSAEEGDPRRKGKPRTFAAIAA